MTRLQLNPVDGNSPAVLRREAANYLYKGAFPRAVRAAQRMDLSPEQLEIDVIKRMNPSVELLELLDGHHFVRCAV